jgi:hypothetical protein
VYVYRTMTSDLEEACKTQWHGQIAVYKHPMLMLLGVHTGQFPEWWDMRNAEAAENETESFSNAQVRGLSGMTRVAPAWGIRQILDAPKLRGRREAAEAKFALLSNTGSASSIAGDEAAVVAEFASPAGDAGG